MSKSKMEGWLALAGLIAFANLVFWCTGAADKYLESKKREGAKSAYHRADAETQEWIQNCLPGEVKFQLSHSKQPENRKATAANALHACVKGAKWRKAQKKVDSKEQQAAEEVQRILGEWTKP